MPYLQDAVMRYSDSGSRRRLSVRKAMRLGQQEHFLAAKQDGELQGEVVHLLIE